MFQSTGEADSRPSYPKHSTGMPVKVKMLTDHSPTAIATPLPPSASCDGLQVHGPDFSVLSQQPALLCPVVHRALMGNLAAIFETSTVKRTVEWPMHFKR